MEYIILIRTILNFFDHFQQKKILKFINNKFSYPVIIFDVGAHYGETINVFTKNINYEKIYSFEASPLNYNILKKKFLSKESLNIKIYNLGLGDKISDEYINQTAESSSSTMNELNKKSKYFTRKLKILKINNKKLYSKKIPVKIITLDYFINKYKIDKIDVLKIDTEGFEFNILKGLSKNFKKVKLIYFEHHYDDMILKNYTFSEINQLLTHYGFKMVKKNKMLFRRSFEYIYENQTNTK